MSNYKMYIKILISIFAILFICSCELPTDKVITYTKTTGKITGFTKPKNIKVIDNYLYVQDDKGLYMLNLNFVDASGDSVTDQNFLYKNSANSVYGSIENFDVTGDYVYICTYNAENSKYYLLKKTIYLNELEAFYVPSKRSITHIAACGNTLLLTGNANIALKGTNSKDTYGNVVFDTSADFIIAKDFGKKNNISISPVKPIGKETAKGYDIYMISMSTDQCGIRKYIYNRDESADNIILKKTSPLDLYPFDICYKKNDTNTLISSEQGRIAIYDILDSEPFIKLNSKISIGSENGALKTIQYNDKLVCLYGYKIIPNEYDKTTYDIYAYWNGIKIVDNAFTNPKISKTITIEGWGTDIAMYENYIFVANQVLNCINVYKI